MPDFPTLIKPPPPVPTNAPIEDTLALTSLSAIQPNLFTNTRPLWHPPGARGIYGGAAIAQCLAAAQRTVPSNFSVHSMHCYFVLNGNAEVPIVYHVENVREGRSFCTRTVQARQRGQPIFTTTLSFMREGAGGKKLVEHAHPMPSGLQAPSDQGEGDDVLRGSPFLSQRVDILNGDEQEPHRKRARQWIKAKGRISEEGGHQAHLSALAYMSDSYFIGTVARVHSLWRGGQNEGLKGDAVPEGEKREIGMMVSLDHSIFFHNPRDFRADEWMYTECESPWSGDGRGLVMQRMFTREGKLIAACVQEGVVRLKQDKSAKL